MAEHLRREEGPEVVGRGERWTLELNDAAYSGQDIEPMLLLTDPPYGTGKTQKGASGSYQDKSDTGYVIESIVTWLPIMNPEGTVVVCCDYRLASQLTVGVANAGWCHRGEIVWEFGLGRPRTSWWPVRHNSLLTFTKTAESGLFDASAIPRTKRLAPAKGYPDDKPSGSVWNFTMSNTDPQRVGYPNQKPLEILIPFVRAHTRAGDLVIDPFCGSSTTGVASLIEGRTYYGIDNNPEALRQSSERLRSADIF